MEIKDDKCLDRDQSVPTTTQTKRKNVYDIVAGKIIEQLEKGVIPWHKNVPELPKNFITQKPYRAVNVLLLTAENFKQPYFLSLNQAKELGATVKENEKGTPVIYWKKFDDERKPALRYFNVYNIAQVDGIPEDKFPSRDKFTAVVKRENRIEFCKEIVRNMPSAPEIVQNSESTFYSHQKDCIFIQPTHFFKDAEDYYSELFENLVQSTGHEKRLARKEFADFFGKTQEFHTEKLIVQIGKFILRTYCGIAGNDAEKSTHSVFAYLDKLRHDRKLIVYAAFRAQQAVDYILNLQKEDVL